MGSLSIGGFKGIYQRQIYITKQDRETVSRLKNKINQKERELSENVSEHLLKQVN